MRTATLCALVAVSVAPACAAAPVVDLDRIVVSSRLDDAARVPARPVTVLSRAVFDAAALHAIPDVIADTAGVDIRRRGAGGVQADLAIRGTTFEQNALFLNGIPLNDPQTGHFLFDVPVTSLDIDAAEIFRGPASSVYGANAFGGVVGLRTARPHGTKVRAVAGGGSFDYFAGAVSVTCPFGPVGNRFSAEETRSRGYMPETWFDTLAVTDTALFETFLGDYEVMLGYLRKDFGAASFYSSLFPNEEEHTDTRLITITGKAGSDGFRVEPKLFFRRHRDKFALDANRPGWQTNYHTTWTRGAALGFVLEHEFLDAAYGIEGGRDTIDSTNMQTHTRDKLALYLELAPRLGGRLAVTAAFREDRFSDFGWEPAPSIAGSYALRDDITARVSIGRAYRIPTFTDLYYADAGSVGNAGLRPESCWSYEAGVDYRVASMAWSATFFHRDTRDTIDWIRSAPAARWQATNIGTSRTNGAEASVALFPRKIDEAYPVERVSLKYTVLDTYAKHDYLSKYALDYLKQHITAGVEYGFLGFVQTWTANYKKRIGDSGYLVVDTRIAKEIIRKDALRLEAFLELSNIGDIDYSEIAGMPMPGRSFRSGARVEF